MHTSTHTTYHIYYAYYTTPQARPFRWNTTGGRGSTGMRALRPTVDAREVQGRDSICSWVHILRNTTNCILRMGAFFSRSTSRAKYLVALAGLVYAFYRRKQYKLRLKARRERSRKGGTNADQKDGKGKRGSLSASYVKSKIWSTFLPKSLRGVGAWELGCMLALHLYRVPLLLRVTFCVQEGDRVLFTRNRKAYGIAQRMFLILAVETALVQALMDYFKKHLNIKWQKKLTHKLHNRYFAKANYYHVETLVDNVDARMTEDVERTAEGYANYLNAIMFNGITGMFYLGKLWSEYGFMYAVSPFVYIATASKIAKKITPFNFKIYSKLSKANAEYRNAQTRLVVHSEAIAALRGAEREKSILNQLYDTMNTIQREVYQKLLPYTISQTFFLRQLLGVVVGWFVLGPGVFRKEGAVSIEKFAQLRAEVGYQFVLFIQVMYSAAMGQRVSTAFNKIHGPAERIVELFQALRTVDDKQASETSASFKNDPNRIAFDAVDIFTPTGNLLVKNLTFDVTADNDSLLLTGHNGAGKSSIFRCLAGLWKVPTGDITKPMDEKGGLSGDVFYLPQKPYNVIGTLVDQLTYPMPAGEAQGLSKDYLRDILGQVELAYLTERDDAFTAEINWEDALSLGEKQRLAIARLIHHKPRFAILDECTSGVAAAMERKLYLLLNEMGLSYITISHRPVLKQMHCKFLCIRGDEEKSYEYKILQTPEELNAYLTEQDALDRKAQVTGGSEHHLVALQNARSEPYAVIGRERDQRRENMKQEFTNKSGLGALQEVLSGGLPAGWKTKLACIVGGIVGQAAVTDLQLLIETEIWRSLFQRDKALFFRTAVYGVGGALAMSLIHGFSQNVQDTLEVDVKESLTKKFMALYMGKAGFYNLKNFDGRIMDPETRMSDDLNEFVEMLSGLLSEVIKPSFTILWLGYRLGVSVGFSSASLLYGYLFGAGILARMTMPDFKSMMATKNATMGKYKYTQSTVRTHSESIAFFGGGAREKAIAWKRFEATMKVDEEKAFADLWFGWIKNLFVRNMPDRVQQHLRFQFAVNNFQDDDSIIRDGGAALTMGQHVIWGIQTAVKRSVQELVDVSDKFNNLSGVIFRLAELQNTLHDLHVPPYIEAGTFGAERKTKTANPKISISEMDIVTPTGICLASNLSVEISPKNRLLVTGPNASGKTSFFRVLGGIWPTYPEKNAHALRTNGDVFLVPQKVYSVTGTLLDQVTYPSKIETKDVTPNVLADAQKLLELVGIGYLVDRDGGWHLVRKFEDVLSLGEQQRLGMARLFYHNPSFAVLDECTDAVSVDVEERLYTTAMDMGITCITISKRLALVDFHEQEICLGVENSDGFESKLLSKTKSR